MARKLKGGRPKAGKHKPGWVYTLVALGHELRRAPSTMHRLSSSLDWTFGKGPWSAEQVEAIRAWVNKRAEAKKVPSVVLAERERLLKARREKLELEMGIMRKEFIPRADVEAGLALRAHHVASGLRRLVRDLSEATPEHSVVVKQTVDALLADYAKPDLSDLCLEDD